jgi:hypothetical protein
MGQFLGEALRGLGNNRHAGGIGHGPHIGLHPHAAMFGKKGIRVVPELLSIVDAFANGVARLPPFLGSYHQSMSREFHALGEGQNLLQGGALLTTEHGVQ